MPGMHAPRDAESFDRNAWWLGVWATAAAFGAYFCMYGFRKPFTAGAYEENALWGVGYKTILVTAQVLGYTISKFIGIKVIAEMTPARRAPMILALIGSAHAALLLFALVPPPFNVVCLFLNGLPLGMVFGLVLGFLEGRRSTEALAAGLCASFILADGVTKSVGTWLLQAGVNEFWMPAASGGVFLLPLLGFVWMLARIPAPSARDIAHRAERVPMPRQERAAFFRRYAPGLLMLGGVYLLVTILRSLRSDFAPEIWAGLGYSGRPAIFTRSEMWVLLGVVLANGLAVLIRDNRAAFMASMGTALAGFALAAVALSGVAAGWVNGFAFMVLIGLGLYLPYVAVHTTVFERLIAMTRDRGNIGYLMYLVDAFGYLGYVAIMLGKGALRTDGPFIDFFLSIAWTVVVVSVALLAGCWAYFAWTTRSPRTAPAGAAA